MATAPLSVDQLAGEANKSPLTEPLSNSMGDIKGTPANYRPDDLKIPTHELKRDESGYFTEYPTPCTGSANKWPDECNNKFMIENVKENLEERFKEVQDPELPSDDYHEQESEKMVTEKRKHASDSMEESTETSKTEMSLSSPNENSQGLAAKLAAMSIKDATQLKPSEAVHRSYEENSSASGLSNIVDKVADSMCLSNERTILRNDETNPSNNPCDKKDFVPKDNHSQQTANASCTVAQNAACVNLAEKVDNSQEAQRSLNGKSDVNNRKIAPCTYVNSSLEALPNVNRNNSLLVQQTPSQPSRGSNHSNQTANSACTVAQNVACVNLAEKVDNSSQETQRSLNVKSNVDNMKEAPCTYVSSSFEPLPTVNKNSSLVQQTPNQPSLGSYSGLDLSSSDKNSKDIDLSRHSKTQQTDTQVKYAGPSTLTQITNDVSSEKLICAPHTPNDHLVELRTEFSPGSDLQPLVLSQTSRLAVDSEGGSANNFEQYSRIRSVVNHVEEPMDSSQGSAQFATPEGASGTKGTLEFDFADLVNYICRCHVNEKEEIDPRIIHSFEACLMPRPNQRQNEDAHVKTLLFHYATCENSTSCMNCKCVNLLIMTHYRKHEALCLLVPCQNLQKVAYADLQQRKHVLKRKTFVQKLNIAEYPLSHDKVVSTFKDHIVRCFVGEPDDGTLSSVVSLQQRRINQIQEQGDGPSTVLSIGDYDESRQDLHTESDREVIYCDVEELQYRAGVWDELRDQHRNQNVPRPEGCEGCILRRYTRVIHIRNGSYGSTFGSMQRLGAGAMGTCSLVQDISSGASFCAKEIEIDMFMREEILVWSGLYHPNIAELMGAIRIHDKILLFSEYLDGGNLHEYIETYGKRSRKGEYQGIKNRNLYVKFMRDILDGLVFMHSINYLHEDIKANNVMLKFVDGSLTAKLIDFGLSRHLPSHEPYVTDAQRPCGGPTQASPEKARCEKYDFKADVWAFACTFIHVISGYMPWQKRFPHRPLIYVIAEYSPPVRDIPDDCPVDVKKFLHSALSVDLEKRPTARKLREHGIFAETAEKIQPGELRRNPRLIPLTIESGLTEDLLQSVPSRPPDKHYHRETSAFHSSIPDLDRLCPAAMSDYKSYSRENDGLSDDENDGLSSIGDESHYNDGLSDNDGEFYSGTERDQEPQNILPNLSILRSVVPKKNSEIVTPDWANIKEVIVPSNDQSSIEKYQLAALGFPPMPANSNLTHIGNSSSEIRFPEPLTPFSGDHGDYMCVATKAPSQFYQQNARDIGASAQITDETVHTQINNQHSTREISKSSETNLADNTQVKNSVDRNQNQYLKSAGGDNRLNLESPSHSQPVIPQDLVFHLSPTANSPSPKDKDSRFSIPQTSRLSDSLSDCELHNDHTWDRDVRNSSPEHEKENNIEAASGLALSRSISRVSTNPDVLLQELQQELAETSLRDPANDTHGGEMLFELGNSLLEQHGNTSEVLGSPESTLETIIILQTENGETIKELCIAHPSLVTWIQVIKGQKEMLDQRFPSGIVVHHSNNQPVTMSNNVPDKQTVILKILPQR